MIVFHSLRLTRCYSTTAGVLLSQTTPGSLCLFVRCSDERSHRSDLFSKDVVTVGAVHPRGDLTAMLLPPSWTRGLVRAMKARC